MYIYPCIYTCSTKTTRIINHPQVSTFIYTCVQHVNNPVTKTSSPLDRRLYGHALTTPTYLSVGATFHKSKLTTYMAISYMKATSNLTHR
jgi:hypothetical protein